MYLCKFDQMGKIEATVISGVHFKTDEEKQKYINNGYIKTSSEYYAYYIGNKGTGKNGTGYARGANGKPTDAPAYEPSIDTQIEALDHQYNSDKTVLTSQYTEADIDGDEELKATIKAELVALREQYDKDYEEIIGGAE